MKTIGWVLAALLAGGAGVGRYALYEQRAAPAAAPGAMESLPVTITGSAGSHVFTVEIARTAAQQEKGLMYRTGIKPDQGMLFWPYPPPAPGSPRAGVPQAANFWMKNTPTPLDILFIRIDGTIAHIAENTVPFSETPIPSGEPVGAVLEIVGGRATDLGIAQGDKVSWPGQH